MPAIKSLESRRIALLCEPDRFRIWQVALWRMRGRFHPWAPQEFPMAPGWACAQFSLPSGTGLYSVKSKKYFASVCSYSIAPSRLFLELDFKTTGTITPA
jgi:hypothetical protein